MERARLRGHTDPYGSISYELTQQGLKPSSKCCATLSLVVISSIALFVIGCIGASGKFPGPSIGWVTVGLGGGSFALLLSLGNFKKRKIDLISSGLVAAALVTIGALGGTGILSAKQVGWGIIGTTLANLPMSCFFNCLKKQQIAQLQHYWE